MTHRAAETRLLLLTMTAPMIQMTTRATASRICSDLGLLTLLQLLVALLLMPQLRALGRFRAADVMRLGRPDSPLLWLRQSQPDVGFCGLEPTELCPHQALSCLASSRLAAMLLPALRQQQQQQQ